MEREKAGERKAGPWGFQCTRWNFYGLFFLGRFQNSVLRSHDIHFRSFTSVYLAAHCEVCVCVCVSE